MRRAALAALVASACLAPPRALAHEVVHSVEPGKAWAVAARYASGEALAYMAFEVYSPADPKIPYLKGRTDRSGYLAFVPDVPGAWRVKVMDESGHGLDTTIAVGAPAPAEPRAAPWGLALRPVLGAAIILGVFAGLAVLYRKRKAGP